MTPIWHLTISRRRFGPFGLVKPAKNQMMVTIDLGLVLLLLAVCTEYK